MAGLVPATHAYSSGVALYEQAWVPGTGPGMPSGAGLRLLTAAPAGR